MSVLIAAPSSGSGKTTITLGLLRALSRTMALRGAKSGPDYIDPRFHEAACAQPCLNLDAWAMTPAQIQARAAGQLPLIVEGAMGLFDGAPPDGKGSAADLARILALRVILVVDAGKMAGSVAALVQGFMRYDPHLEIAGVILNNVGSARHEAMLRRALGDISVLGAVPRDATLIQPARHLGLVQAQEHPELDIFLDRAADIVTAHVDLEHIVSLLKPLPARPVVSPRPPPAQRIAIAQDAAFAFSYPHILQEWHAAGAELSFFSPLANQTAPDADFLYLPGGYPELHAGRLAGNTDFLESLHTTQAVIYGECGGYMTLGETLTDAKGNTHAMAGLLPLQTSFAARKLHLGYRHLTAAEGPLAGRWTGHEFHYATTTRADGPPLFAATDAEGTPLPPMGLVQGNVMGSFGHIIDHR
ncbi:cobyrinate a,c-diamide synthase [Yoonia sp.]|uniref:cobyrinate a,c-diamide synthase n=1 Tax=Yoonia sp. TaxID=2212373 RepID=UPI0035C7C9E9